jgi:hypothetical protein
MKFLMSHMLIKEFQEIKRRKIKKIKMDSNGESKCNKRMRSK